MVARAPHGNGCSDRQKTSGTERNISPSRPSPGEQDDEEDERGDICPLVSWHPPLYQNHVKTGRPDGDDEEKLVVGTT